MGQLQDLQKDYEQKKLDYMTLYMNPDGTIPGKKYEVVDVIATEKWSRDNAVLNQFEEILNRRERKLQTDRIYRVWPFGTVLPGTSAPAQDEVKAIIECHFCGRHGARGCACPGCGAPIR